MTKHKLPTFYPCFSSDTEVEVPPPEDEWGEIASFALSFNGYKFAGGGPIELDALLEKIGAEEREPTIPELRANLFMLQRAGRFCGDEGSDSDLAYGREIVKQIVERIENDQP